MRVSLIFWQKGICGIIKIKFYFVSSRNVGFINNIDFNNHSLNIGQNKDE